MLQEHKGDDILLGFIPFGGKPDEYIICITGEGKRTVMTRLRNLRKEYEKKIFNTKNVKPKKWVSLGSEKEIEDFYYRNTRPLVSSL